VNARIVLRNAATVFLGLLALAMLTLLQADPVRARLQTTLLLSASVAFWATALGTYWANCLVRFRWPGRGLSFALLTALAVVPLYVQAASWEAGFGKLGWYTVAQGMGETPWLTSWRAALWVYTVAATPWATAIVAAGYGRLDRRVEDLATTERGPWAAWWFVVFPPLAPAITIAFVFLTIMVSSELTVADLYMIDTVARELYIGFALGNTVTENWRAASPMLACWLLWSTVCISTALRGQRRRTSRNRTRPQPPAALTGGNRLLAIATVPLPLILLTAVPIGSLFLVAGRSARMSSGFVERSWSFRTLGTNLWSGFSEFQSEMLWTSVIGVVAATLTVLLAAGGVRWARTSRLGLAIVLLINGLLFVAPGPLLGLTLVSAFNSPPLPWLHRLYDQSIAAPVLVGVLRTLPIASVAMSVIASTVSEAVRELADLDGLSGWRRWRKVDWPLTRTSVWMTWLISLAIVMGEHSATFAVTPPGITTMAHRIFVLIHSGARQKQASLTLLAQSCFLMIAIAIAGLYWSRCMKIRNRFSKSATPPNDARNRANR
jgi:ABC-type Fe3+ transport system permease subunit